MENHDIQGKYNKEEDKMGTRKRGSGTRQVVIVYDRDDEEYVNKLLAGGFHIERMEGSGQGWVMVYLTRFRRE